MYVGTDRDSKKTVRTVSARFFQAVTSHYYNLFLEELGQLIHFQSFCLEISRKEFTTCTT